MDETYVATGLEVSPVIALIFPLMTLLGIAWRKARGKPIEPRWIELLGSLVSLVLPFLLLTMDQAFGILLAAMAIGQGLDSINDRRYPAWQHAVGVVLILAMAAGTAFLFNTAIGGRITLTQSEVVFEDGRQKGRAPRKGLEVHATGGSRDWWSWTSFAPNGELGPHVMGSELFRGPQGVIRGDDVGLRMATWAGTKPIYTQR